MAIRTTRIEQAADGKSWNLYVNDAIAVSYESHAVCEQIEAALMRGGYYSEVFVTTT